MSSRTTRAASAVARSSFQPRITRPRRTLEKVSPVPGKYVGIMSMGTVKYSSATWSYPAMASAPSIFALVTTTDLDPSARTASTSSRASSALMPSFIEVSVSRHASV